MLIMLPWGIRNYNLFQTIIPVSTNGGYNFLMGNHANSSGTVNFNFEYDLSNPNEVKESEKAYTLAFSDILKFPVDSAVRIMKKIFYTYYRGDSSVTWGLKLVEENISPFLKSFIFYVSNLFFYTILFLNICLFIIHRKKISFNQYSDLIIISIYFITIVIIYYGSERYHVPLLPIHFFIAAKYFETQFSKKK